MDTDLSLPFPPVPAGADKEILKPSASFNSNVYRSIGAVLLFIVTYIVLLLAVVGLAIAFGTLGVAIIAAKVGFLTLVLGAALIGSGILLVYFIIKFLFKQNVTDYSGMIEISEDDQQKLFAFIRQLTKETNAPFPKHIFLSADVNAGVFYDSSFWSMFFPVKKNLKIGLGLVNSLNISEFKAVMAHEFGHFSQRSMKFGSYVYNMNKVIHNLLYDNEGYGRVLNSISKLHSLFTLTAWINIQVIRVIQYILKQVYVVLNKTYMGLSREMEFHADAMAAYVSGSNQVISSLKRIEVGQLCYNELLNYWSTQLEKNNRSDNFYPQHLEMIKHYSVQNKLAIDANGLPVIPNGIDVVNTSQVVINDQWSSHPSTADREARLTALNLQTMVIEDTAWSLFNDAGALQRLLTDDVYSTTSATEKTESVGLEVFKSDFFGNPDQYKLDDFYKGYYDGRGISQFDVDEAVKELATAAPKKIEDLLSAANTSLPTAIDRMQQDINVLQSIVNEGNNIKTFDYKGIKHRSSDAEATMQAIEQERLAAAQQLEKLDKDIFMYFYSIAKSDIDKELLVAKYKKLFKVNAGSQNDYELYTDVMTYFNNVYVTMPYDKIEDNLHDIYAREVKLKPRMLEILQDEENLAYFSDEQLKALKHYCTTKLTYFTGRNYDNAAINAFNEGTGAYILAITNRNFQTKKDLLSLQVSMLNSK
ncbi:M48 family metalloprotease [Mucilaginibacter sp. AK015]|uniref:M48 family metalloprotease n=1 Tax=Mucilaginibacter sp. AK015 TaxID=2723072 RepID=UPI0016165362|nr:M48 family metallopeptidase [Mucilaginibacter sp. AK015]MBB5395941.1 Zn-dependent protease with chaperone function [Mucilaginibacter sp. AK015]